MFHSLSVRWWWCRASQGWGRWACWHWASPWARWPTSSSWSPARPWPAVSSSGTRDATAGQGAPVGGEDISTCDSNSRNNKPWSLSQWVSHSVCHTYQWCDNYVIMMWYIIIYNHCIVKQKAMLKHWQPNLAQLQDILALFQCVLGQTGWGGVWGPAGLCLDLQWPGLGVPGVGGARLHHRLHHLRGPHGLPRWQVTLSQPVHQELEGIIQRNVIRDYKIFLNSS